ncbi:NUDIX domain-containing protein [Candidatus Woesearchaeota archaeon]|nr:NUDIX domain-containing protein [Candidatus Woesearchaeota archaeon]HIH25544.1 NUDIX domain-containing protein [Nanoarchaeota archaeon]
MEEQIYEVDWEDNIIGIRDRSELKQRMFVHRVSLVIPKTLDNKFVFSRRSKDKQPFPDVWCCAIGGKVQANESYEEAALREMVEEAGFQTGIEDIATIKYDGKTKEILKVFTTKESVKISNFIPNEETQYFKDFTIEEINNMIKYNPNDFAPTFLEVLKEFKKSIN